MEKNNLIKELEKIKERNRKVEIEKAWETSDFRKILIVILTYMTMSLFFYFSGTPNPFINAIVPTLGFLLSTFSMNFFKKIWIKYFYKN